MNLKYGVKKMDLKNNSKELRVYDQVCSFFANQKGFSIELANKPSRIDVRKIGSELNFKMTLGDLGSVNLEVCKTDMIIGSGFAKNVVGVLKYLPNGSCDDKKRILIPNKRQQAELDEMIAHIEKCLRPNSINFILED